MSEAGSGAAPARPSRINRNVLIGGAVVVLPLLAVLVLNLGRDPHNLRSPLIGRAAPPFSLVPVGGGPPVTLEGLRGKTVIINFWATWCVPCFQEHAALVEASRSLSGVQFLGVVYEDDEKRTREFIAERGTGYPTLMDSDGRAAIAYGVFGVPETFFIDGNGRIVDKYVGPLNRGTILALAERAKDGVR
jgi:cytochrome c biogenesis protein CcmG, thiol:disulfide interchange protein DsbE